MMAMQQAVARTIAFVYHDEQLVRRNQLRRKLESYGFTIKKEYESSSRDFHFSSVDLVVAIREGTGGARNALDAAAERDGKDLVYINHNTSRGGWDRLATYAPAPPALALVPPPPESIVQTRDEETTELFALLEQERDNARAEVQRLNGDLGNVRADRERLTNELAEAKRKLGKAEIDLEAAKLTAGEARDQRGLVNQIATLTEERDAARVQNHRHTHDLKALREKVERLEGAEERANELSVDLELAQAQSKDFENKYRASAASEVMATKSAAELRAKLEGRGESTALRAALEQASVVRAELDATKANLAEAQAEAREYSERVDALIEQLDALSAAPTAPPPAGDDFAETARAFQLLVRRRMMTADEALAKLAEAAP